MVVINFSLSGPHHPEPLDNLSLLIGGQSQGGPIKISFLPWAALYLPKEEAPDCGPVTEVLSNDAQLASFAIPSLVLIHNSIYFIGSL